MEPAPRAKWCSASFIVPKKDGSPRWITDLRHLNQNIVRAVYPIPKIQELLQKRPSYKFVIILDLSDQYYTFVVKEECRHLLTTATPFGLFRYKRLPQGISIGPDVAQEAMENLFREFSDNVTIYFDDMAIFSDTWENLLQTLREVLEI